MSRPYKQAHSARDFIDLLLFERPYVRLAIANISKRLFKTQTGLQFDPRHHSRIVPAVPQALCATGMDLPHTSRAVSAPRPSLASWSATVKALPSIVEAKPHCGLRASRSRSTKAEAASMRDFSSSLLSQSGFLELTRPSKTGRSFGP